MPLPALPTKATQLSTTTSHSMSHRCLVRVDAFLGEWLSPDYFEQITPPPNSERMVGSAKAELLRHGEAIFATTERSPSSGAGYFPGGWGSFSNQVSPGNDKDVASRMPAMSYVLGPRTRAGSYDTHIGQVSNPRAKAFLTKINTDLDAIQEDGYLPPTPSYAVSSSDPIPPGYVAHAREACVEVDYKWDSMQEPQNWGDGGEFGEEWNAMHLRFCRGLEKMVDWYRSEEEAGPRSGELEDKTIVSSDGEDDDAFDTVLILITHGAGCNALIGALTGQPALFDVGVASLTIAERRDSHDAQSGPSHYRNSLSSSLALDYELKVVASTDHLRSGVNPAQLPLTASPTNVPSSSSSSPSTTPFYRHRYAPRTSMSSDRFMIGPSIPHATGVRVLGLANRPSSAPRSVSGLWGPMSVFRDESFEPPDDIVPNFEDPNSSSVPLPQDGVGPNAKNGIAGCSTESTWTKQLPQRTLSQSGLWGSAPTMADRDAAVKRRWTVTERRP